MSETEYERIIEEIKANEIDTNPSDTYINDIPGKLDKIIDDGISFFSEKNRQSQTNPLDSDSE